MAKTVADLIIERLMSWGVHTVFGLPGDGINGLFEALRTHADQLRRMLAAGTVDVLQADATLCALTRVRHVEYFHDHARIEHMLYDGVLTPIHGMLQPDLSRPGLGLAFKHADAARYAV